MKKWNLWIAAGLLAFGSASLTGCIDDNEPAGIREMRGAKAEYYSALAAVQNAEAQYRAAMAAHELQIAENQRLLNRAQELANELQEASNEKDKAALSALIAEIQAKHEVEMKNIATAQSEADKAYEVSLKELQTTISKLNGEYTAEFSRILARITDNRYRYNLRSAQLTDLNIELMTLTTGKVDTTSERNRLNLAISQEESKVGYLTSQKESVESVTGIGNADRTAKISELDKQIREAVNSFNETVDEYNRLTAQYQKESDDVNRQKAANDNANKAVYNATETFAVTVAPIIQHDFILNTGEYRTPEDEDGQIFSREVKGQTVWSLKNGSYSYTKNGTNATNIGEANFTLMTAALSTSLQATESSLNTALSEATRNSSEVSFSGNGFDQTAYDKIMTTLTDRQNALESLKAAYETDKQAWETARNAYVAARQAYMFASSRTYYEYVQSLVAELKEKSMAKKATAADTTAVVNALAQYGTRREALDGFCTTTPAGTGYTKNYETLTLKNYTEAQALAILGSPDLKTAGTNAGTNTNYADKPYAVYMKTSNKAFGTIDGNITATVFNAPVDEEELIVSSNYGGSYAKYFAEYRAVNTLLQLQAWKTAYDEIKAGTIAYTQKSIARKITETSQSETLVQLEAVAAATRNKQTLTGKNIDDATEYAVATYDDTDPQTAGNSRTISVALKNGGGIGGFSGNHINQLATLHNGLVSGVTSYESMLRTISEELNKAEQALAEAKQKLYEFEHGGYELTNSYNHTALSVGNNVTVSMTQSASSDETLVNITVRDSQGNIVSTTEIPYKYFSFTAGNPFNSPVNVPVISTNYLKTAIETIEADIAKVEDEMKNLDAELEQIQKEKDAFVAIIDARYPNN